jgi:hypothetical protein
MNEKKIQVDYFVSVRYLYHLREGSIWLCEWGRLIVNVYSKLSGNSLLKDLRKVAKLTNIVRKKRKLKSVN